MNAGSSSLKASVLEAGETRFSANLPPAGRDELDEVLARLLERAPGFDAAAHRVVHGGDERRGAVRLDAAGAGALERLSALAPLHNPAAIAVIECLWRLRPGLEQFACFDTTFHSSLAPEAATYALPRAWARRWGLRRYGFHGLSHAWAVRRTAELVGRASAGLDIVSAHLGAGASLAAVRGGRSIDTTMGFTPLEGLVMATRSGSVDPGILVWILSATGLDAAALSDGLERRSGLLGLCGSADLREVLARADSGDEAAGLAYGVYLHRLRAGIGAMVASLGGLDALVFTGGAGEASARLRDDACATAGYLGLRLDRDANATARADAVVSPPESPVAVAVVTAREDLEIAAQVAARFGTGGGWARSAGLNSERIGTRHRRYAP